MRGRQGEPSAIRGEMNESYDELCHRLSEERLEDNHERFD